MIDESTLINVEVSLAQTAGQGQDTSDLLVVTSNTVIDLTQRYRSYTSSSAVGADFGTAGLEFQAAVKCFAINPTPPRILIGTWAEAARAGQLLGGALTLAQQALANFTGISDGGFGVSINGAAVEQVVGINLVGAVTLNGIATLITAALAGAATVQWNPIYNRFQVTSATTGTASAISFLTAPTGGVATDLSSLLGLSVTFSGSYTAAGVAAESALACATLFDANFGGQWYAMVMPSIVADADHLAVQAFLQSGSTRKHFYGATTQEAGALVPTSTTDLAYTMGNSSNNKSMCTYSSTSAVAVVSALARILFVNYSGQNTMISLAYQTMPTLTPENISSGQLAILMAKNCNVYAAVDNGVPIFFPGTTCVTNQFVDTVIGADVFGVALQAAGFNTMYTAASSGTKVAQDDGGTVKFINGYTKTCEQFLACGFLGPGDWNGADFGSLNSGDYMESGYYIYGPPTAQQAQVPRSARVGVPIQIAGNCSGAVNTTSVLVTLQP